jgi:cell division protein FtsL
MKVKFKQNTNAVIKKRYVKKNTFRILFFVLILLSTFIATDHKHNTIRVINNYNQVKEYIESLPFIQQLSQYF